MNGKLEITHEMPMKHPKKTIFKPKTQKRDKKICVLKEKAVTLHTLLRETAP